MGKSFKYVLIIVLFLAIFLSYYFKNKTKFNDIKIDKNNIVVNDFEMSKRISDNEYYVIKALKAEYSKNFNKVKMESCNVVYKKGQDKLELNADVCEYLIDKKVILSGKIFGFYNDIDFKTISDKVESEYDFVNKNGKIDGRVVFHRRSNYIKSDKVYFFRKGNKVEFMDNVEVIYEMAD